ncbi:MAG: DUF4430 domain-containing protein [Clostridia bacterium]|nr:DUF4430 domain-containing protein [Clostridia bacterium]
MKKGLTLSLSLVLVLSLCLALGGCFKPADYDTPVAFTVIVVHLDGTEKTFEYETTKSTLGDALLEKGLIDGHQDTYGLTITTVDGVYYDWNTSGIYWSLLINGEYAMTGADSTVIEEGTVYSLVATKM